MGAALILDISKQLQALDTARAFAAIAAQHAASADASCAVAPPVWAAFFDGGLATSPLPRAFGGCDLADPDRSDDLCAVLRLVGAADLSIGRLFEGHVNAIGLVCRYGSPAQVAELASAVTAGALCGVWGADDAAGLHIDSDAGGDRLSGRKVLASGAGFITRPLVTAEGRGGQQMCLLSLAPGYAHDVSGWQAQGMRATATGTVDFTGMAIGAREQIGAPGDYMRQPTFAGGAWRFCAVQLGAVERLVDLFRQHLLETRRGDDPFQLQRVATCVAAARTGRFWVEQAARNFGGDGDPGDTVAFAHLTRMTVERCALTVMETVQRGIGLRALVRPHEVERICRDLATYLRQPAPDLAMLDAARTYLRSPAAAEFG